ncbi:MAG: ATP-binding cassette domain-containing protein, partial [Actinomycetota bacterium]
MLGTNGAGKTTLLRTIAGLLQPDAGAVRLNGADITTFPADWRPGLGLAHVAGADSLAGPLTVDEHLRMFALDLDGDELDARLARTFEVFPRLAERHGQVVSTLSGGEKQMLALAKAFVHRPDVLLVDEFSLGLAPVIVSELIPIVAELNAEGTAVLLVEQSVATALELADRVLCIERG